MIRDLQLGLPSPDLYADVIVVGAGAAGITLTVELARQGKSVLLLEGGGPQPEPATQDLYRAELAGLPHRGVHGGRSRVHGGTTTQWGGQILELEKADFEDHSWVPGSGWPFPKTDLIPFYRRALAAEGLSGALQDDREVWRELREKPPVLDALDLYLSRWCPEPNFARLRHTELAQNPRIDVWLHANAVEVHFEGTRACGVHCRTLTGQEASFYARSVVFALGTIETCRFFLQQPASGRVPWNESGLLGRHFQDHIDADAAVLRPRSPGAFHAAFDSIFLHGFKYNPKLRLTPVAREGARTLAVGGTVFSSSAADDALAAVKGTAKQLLKGRLAEVPAADLTRCFRHAPLVARQTFRYAVQHRGFHPADAEIRLRVHCEQEPLSASTVSLTDDRDALGLRRARLDWRISPEELRSMRCFVEAARQSLAPLAEVLPHPDLLAGDNAFLAHCQDGYHQMGGMRMSTSALSGVVDTDMRLHNTQNLFACSSAVFPTCGFSNPTHTLLALTMRLADHLVRTS